MQDVGENHPVAAQTNGGHGMSRRKIIVVAAALGAAILASFAGAEPTGTPGWDILLTAGTAALFVVAASACPDWVLVVAATVAAMLIGDSIWLAPVALGLLLTIAAGATRTRHDALDVLGAALAVQGLLRLPEIGFFGLSSLIAGAAIVVVLYFGYRRAPEPVRRGARRVVGATTALTAIICAVGGLVLLGARDDVEIGINAARAGLSAARSGEPEAVVLELETAADALTAAEQRATSLFAQPLRLVPVAAQHHRAVTTATGQGSAIARQASIATINADISTVKMTAGSVDLSALSSMQEDLAETVRLLETGLEELDETASRWLIPQVASRLDDLTEEMRDVLPEARVAADAARVVPGLLGQDQPRRYFVAFGSPAESRELGGFMGSWAILEFDQGTVRQAAAGRTRDLYELVRDQEPLSLANYPTSYIDLAQPGYWPQNIGGSPQLSVVANAARELFDGLDGGAIDGFVYADGYALGAMLEITGPIDVDGVEGRLTAGNAEGFFFDEQYRLTNRQELKAEVGEVFAGVFAGLLDSELPGPERLGQVLGPAARQGRLQVATFDDDENAFLTSVKLQRDFTLPTNTADAFGIVQANGSVSKLDLYLRRDVTYDIDIDDTGELTGSLTVELTSDVPDDAPEYALGSQTPGLSIVYLSMYTPHELTEVRVDGQAVGVLSLTEFGYQRYQVTVELPANTSATVEFDVVGNVDPDREYDLSIWHQPLVNNDMMQINVSSEGAPPIAEAFELVENAVISPTQ